MDEMEDGWYSQGSVLLQSLIKVDCGLSILFRQAEEAGTETSIEYHPQMSDLQYFQSAFERDWDLVYRSMLMKVVHIRFQTCWE